MARANRLARGSRPETAPKRPNRGQFQKGHVRVGGRKPGTPNRIPRETLRQIYEGIMASGFDRKGKGGIAGYVKRICDTDLVRGAALVIALVPKQLKFDLRSQHVEERRAVLDLRAELVGKGVPDYLLEKLLAAPPIEDEYAEEYAASDDMADDNMADEADAGSLTGGGDGRTVN